MEKITSTEIKRQLRERYCAPEWAVFFEVANGTGATSRRYADAVAMNLFPSRGLGLHGFEIKISRNDFKNEMKNPHKAEEIAQFCDRWWIVAPKGMIAPEELPEAWGLIVSNGGLRESKPAKQLDPKPLTKCFFAALARRANQSDEAEIESIVESRLDIMRKNVETERLKMIEARDKFYNDHYKAEKYDKIRIGLDQIEKEIGIKIFDEYKEHQDFLKAAELVKKIGVLNTYNGVGKIRDLLNDSFNKFDQAIKELNISRE